MVKEEKVEEREIKLIECNVYEILNKIDFKKSYPVDYKQIFKAIYKMAKELVKIDDETDASEGCMVILNADIYESMMDWKEKLRVTYTFNHDKEAHIITQNL